MSILSFGSLGLLPEDKEGSMTGHEMADRILRPLKSLFGGKMLRVKYDEHLYPGIQVSYANVPEGAREIDARNAKQKVMLHITSARYSQEPWDPAPEKVKAKVTQQRGVKFRGRTGAPDKIATYVVNFFKKNAQALKGVAGESMSVDGWQESKKLIAEASGQNHVPLASFPVLGGHGHGVGPEDTPEAGDELEEETWGAALTHLRIAKGLAKKVAAWAKEVPALVDKIAQRSKEAEPHPKAYLGPQRTQESDLADMARVLSFAVSAARGRMELVTIAMRHLAKGDIKRARTLVDHLKKGLDPALK
jgi:hypothetical protein